MELTQLAYFDAIARHGSISAASRELGVSQPSLSVAMRNLEKELQTTLFARHSQGVELTVTGRELHVRAEHLLAFVEETVERIQDLESGEVGSFAVGASPATAGALLAPFLSDFLPGRPGIGVGVVAGTPAELRDAVLARRVHLALITDAEPHPDLVMVTVCADELGVWLPTSEGYGPVGGRTASLAPDASHDDRVAWSRRRLRQGPVVLDEGGAAGNLLAAIEEAGLCPPRVVRCTGDDVAARLVAAGVGVGLLPARTARAVGGLVQLRTGLDPVPLRVQLLYRADMHRTRAAMRLKDALVAWARRESEP